MPFPIRTGRRPGPDSGTRNWPTSDATGRRPAPLVTLLAGGDPPRPGEPVHTTGYWYVRLCRAVLSSAGPSDVLSASFAALPPATRTQAMQALLELPEEIGLESLRTLAPLIGHLHQRHRLNALGIEVLAAAVHLQADVYLSAPSPRLEEALRAEHRHVELVP